MGERAVMDCVRFGIVGAVGRGNSYVRSLLANPSTEITALCDVRLEEAQHAAAELGVEHVFDSMDALLEAAVVDAVVIGTPMQFHAPQAMAALARDVHVLCEVTAGVSIEECRDLVCAARRSSAPIYDGGKLRLYEAKRARTRAC